MSDYTQITDFSAKDALTTGDPEKIILGADLDAELSAISTAIASKYDSNDIASQAQAEALTLDTVLITPHNLNDVLQANGGMLGDIQALADPGFDTILGWDDSGSAVIGFTLGDGLEFSGTTIRLEHLGLGDLEDPGADRGLFWDDSASALAWLTFGTAFTVTDTTVDFDLLGIEDLTDPGADRFIGWDDSAGNAIWFRATQGLETSGDILRLAAAAASSTNAVDIAGGAVTIDLTALDTIEGNALAAGDRIFVDDGGVQKAILIEEAGMRVQTAQTSQTIAAADMNSIMEFTGTATLTIPTNATTDLPTGVPIVLNMRHATQVLTVTASSGVDLVSINHPNGADGESDTVDAGGTALLYQTADDRWVLTGDTAD